MKIKGLTIRTTPEFVRKNYPSRYEEWLNALPEHRETSCPIILWLTNGILLKIP